ncbi:MAG TPA: SRPBCC family protein [Propionibacteriaceae bacterium]|jgi:hypothetical protein|nr:SRPBCC family protein [Propionibacteriaceae bacterium]
MTETYLVERSATIAAAPQHIYDRLVDFHAWMDWSPWEDLDPKQVRSFTGAEAGVGAGYAWSGNRKAGRGSMQITHAVEPKEVRIALDFEKPFKSANTIDFFLTPEGPNSTRVRWTMVGPKTLATKVMGLFTSMDKMIGPDFEKGLARLKDVVETRPPS